MAMIMGRRCAKVLLGESPHPKGPITWSLPLYVWINMSPSLLLFILIVSKIYLFIGMHSVCVCVWCTCHSSYAEVKGESSVVCSFFLPWGPFLVSPDALCMAHLLGHKFLSDPLVSVSHFAINGRNADVHQPIWLSHGFWGWWLFCQVCGIRVFT